MSAIVTELCAEVDALRKQNAVLVEALGELMPFAASWLQETYGDEHVQHASYIKAKRALAKVQP